MEKIPQLEMFITKLIVSDPRVDDVFQDVLIEGMELLEFGDYECAELFDVSRPTVTRWRNGSTAPHRAMRLPLCKVLRKEAGKRLRMLRLRRSAKYNRKASKIPKVRRAFA